MKNIIILLFAACFLSLSACQDPITSGFTSPQINPSNDICGRIALVLNENYWVSSEISGTLQNNNAFKTMTLTGKNRDGSKLSVIVKDFSNLNVDGVANGNGYKMAAAATNTDNAFSFEYTTIEGEVVPIEKGELKVLNCDVANRTIDIEFDFVDDYPAIKYSGREGKVLTVCYKKIL
ncbi:MAG: hypothetical protein ACKVTZ_19870 [Bacteroidia bacterium]